MARSTQAIHDRRRSEISLRAQKQRVKPQISLGFYVPVPVKLTFCGLPPPLSLTETVADRAPVAAGVNVTLMKQLAPDATLLPQVVVCLKSPGFVPVIETLRLLTAASLLLLSVMVFDKLVVPSG